MRAFQLEIRCEVLGLSLCTIFFLPAILPLFHLLSRGKGSELQPYQSAPILSASHLLGELQINLAMRVIKAQRGIPVGSLFPRVTSGLCRPTCPLCTVPTLDSTSPSLGRRGLQDVAASLSGNPWRRHTQTIRAASYPWILRSLNRRNRPI